MRTREELTGELHQYWPAGLVNAETMTIRQIREILLDIRDLLLKEDSREEKP